VGYRKFNGIFNLVQRPNLSDPTSVIIIIVPEAFVSLLVGASLTTLLDGVGIS